jgi:hypothetical protein
MPHPPGLEEESGGAIPLATGDDVDGKRSVERRGNAADGHRPRCLVEASSGLGDIIEATPTCHALWLLGFDVDLVIDRSDAWRIAPLFENGSVLGCVFTGRDQIDPARYDMAVACFGPAQAARRVSPGFWFSVTLRDVIREGLMGANLAPARLLGHVGDAPAHLVHLDDEGLDVPPGSVVVHAGSDPRSAYKRWPHWEIVCDRVRDEGFHVIVVGTGPDRSPSGWEQRHDCRFDLPLPRLAALLRRAHAYLGTDTGVSHLAGAVGTSGLLLFGPTDPRCYAPASPALRVLDTPPRGNEGRFPASRTFPAMDRLDLETVFSEVSRILHDPRRSAPCKTPVRRDAPAGDAAAHLPTAAEIDTAPRTLEGIDDLLERTTSAAILGWITRRGDATAVARWRWEIDRAIGLVHLRAAAIRRGLRTEISHRRARSHLREAFRAGYLVRASAGRLVLEVTKRSTLRPEKDPLHR